MANEKGCELGILKNYKEAEFSIGDENDFVIVQKSQAVNKEFLWYESQVFIPGTEFGGIVKDVTSLTKSKTVKFMGDTWRGMLSKKIISPPLGQDYLTVSGELSEVVRKLLQEHFGTWFVVPGESTGVTVTYQFNRYVTLLEGLTSLLESVNYKLDIKYIQGAPGEAGYVEVSAVPINNYSEEEEYSQDCNIQMTVRDCQRGINHLICLGKGELKDRLRVDLFVQKDGSIGKVQYYKGFEERTDVYDYSSADAADLEEGGKKRLKELADYKEFDMDIEKADLELGDIVSGRDHITGLHVAKPVIQKILKISNGKERIDYKLKGD
nr:MAG TPA: hypothetical protein [Caudoviricetes sp.]